MRLDDVLGDGAWLIGTLDDAPVWADTRVPVTCVSLDDARLVPYRAGLEAWLAAREAQAVLVRSDRYVFGTGAARDVLVAFGEALPRVLQRA
jgi:3-(3-hydroxy-phenyl)propionate hydroxylase